MLQSLDRFCVWLALTSVSRTLQSVTCQGAEKGLKDIWRELRDGLAHPASVYQRALVSDLRARSTIATSRPVLAQP